MPNSSKHDRPLEHLPGTSLSFSDRVLAWFDMHGRKDLPWQTPRDPYRVWISEIMLQQTQVTTVIDYFHRFMARFPDLPSLAHSDMDSVLSLWAGLGYYARARNLHRTAQYLMERHEGNFPETIDELESLPGIGRSTAGAILSLGLDIPAPILDGNVRRVLARHDAVQGWPGQSGPLKHLWTLSTERTPEIRTANYNQAMMDLGALICTPKAPACERCPLSATCIAQLNDEMHRYPERRPTKAVPVRQAFWLILRNEQGEIYLESRPPSGLWGGLWTLPEFEQLEELNDWCVKHMKPEMTFERMRQQRHTFSHFHLDFVPILSDIVATTGDGTSPLPGRFHDPERLDQVPAPVKSLLRTLK